MRGNVYIRISISLACPLKSAVIVPFFWVNEAFMIVQKIYFYSVGAAEESLTERL